jgi:hypothetical protein
LPIGPEFQDPDPVPNYLPYIDTAYPYPETVATLSGMPAQFEITVKDPNADDLITVRWVANYPPYLQNSTMLLGQSQATPINPDTGSVHITSPDLTCGMFPSSTEKTLVVIVSDRDFLQPEDQRADRNYRFSYRNDGDAKAMPPRPPTQSLVLVGWRIAGCSN